MIAGYNESPYWGGRDGAYGKYQWKIKYYKWESDDEIERAVDWAFGPHVEIGGSPGHKRWGFETISDLVGRPIESHIDGRSGGWFVVDSELDEDELEKIDDYIDEVMKGLPAFLKEERAAREDEDEEDSDAEDEGEDLEGYEGTDGKMKTTEWRLLPGGKERIRARYGIDTDFAEKHNQAPYFAITADTQEKRGTRWYDSGGGAAHGLIAKAFPKLAPLIKWHLVSTEGPTHYKANARYWWDMAHGRSAWERRSHDPDPIEAFKSTVIFGAVPGDKLPSADGSNLDNWLEERLPTLMDNFRVEMEEAGVL